MTVYNRSTQRNTAQNSFDNLPSYHPDNQIVTAQMLSLGNEWEGRQVTQATESFHRLARWFREVKHPPARLTVINRTLSRYLPIESE